MADISASNWNQTDASNTTAAPDGAPEGMAPSGVNNTIRAMAGAIKRRYVRTTPATTAGTTTAFTLTYSVAPASYADGETFLVLFDQTCGSTPTININSLGAKTLKKFSGGSWTDVSSSDIAANDVLWLYYHSSSGTMRIFGKASVWTSSPTTVYLDNTGLKIKDTNASHGLIIAPGSDLTADRTLTVTTGDSDRTLTMTGDATISGTTSGTNTGDVSAATQAEQETGSSTSVYVSPGRQHYHQSAAKVWGVVGWSGGTPSLSVDYGCSTLVDDGTGVVTVNFDTSFSSTDYSPQNTNVGGGISGNYAGTRATGSCQFVNVVSGAASDTGSVSFVIYGDV
jgi:hypothetical protein